MTEKTTMEDNIEDMHLITGGAHNGDAWAVAKVGPDRKHRFWMCRDAGRDTLGECMTNSLEIPFYLTYSNAVVHGMPFARMCQYLRYTCKDKVVRYWNGSRIVVLSEEHILLDLDGTLAEYRRWQGPAHIGEPVPAMLKRLRDWLTHGRDVKIFTARVSSPEEAERDFAYDAIQTWLHKHLGMGLAVTCVKTFTATEIWDDRAITVQRNEGKPTAPVWGINYE